jgi:ATP-binding cassette subfamily B protein
MENQKKRGQLLKLLPYATGSRAHFVIAFVASILAVISNYLTPQVIRITVDSVIGSQPFSLPAAVNAWIAQAGGREMLRNHLAICAAFALVFSVLSGLFNYLSRVSMAKASEGTINRLRNKLFLHIQHLPYQWHNQHQTGDIIQRCTMDVDMVRNFIAEQLLEMVRTVFLIVFSLALMFTMNVQLSLLALVFIPLVLLYSIVFYQKIGGKFQHADEAEGALTAVVQENLTGVRVVRAFGREKYEIDRFDEKNNKFSGLWLRLGNLLGFYWGIGDFVSGLQVMTIIVAGSVQAVSGSITLGEFIVFVFYNAMLVWPVRSLGRILSELSKTGISSSRLNEILDAVPEQDSEDAKESDMTGDIVFDDVSFAYSDSKEVVSHVSFTIKAGTTFGILGATGSGKSTLMYLLDRLYELPPNGGSISIGGTDIRKIKLEWLRRHIGIVLQEPFLFSKSFQQSISDGAETHELETVRHFAKLAAIDDTILGFSQGYETQIGERGVTVSGGQKQRVAIARMLMQDAPIKIFDDSLSAVDTETDAKIRNSINNHVKGTTILISHRITTLMNADTIVVIDKGKLLELGTHAELIASKGLYSKIYEMQSLAGTQEEQE